MLAMRNQISIASLLGLFLLIVCAGCDSGRLKTYPVQGKVVFADGKPVKVGTIETKSVEHGVQASGTIGTDGSFTLTTYQANDGAVAGKHRCVIVQFIPIEEIPNYRPSTMGVIHRKHSTYATSDLVLNIEPGEENPIRLEVQGADPISSNAEEHGHDPVPTDSNAASNSGTTKSQ